MTNYPVSNQVQNSGVRQKCIQKIIHQEEVSKEGELHFFAYSTIVSDSTAPVTINIL